MLKSIFTLFIAVTLLSSCGSEVAEVTKSKYYLTMTGSGESIESNNCNYMGSGSKMQFELDKKGELHIFDMYSLMSDSEMSSFEGQSFPAKVIWNLAEFEGEVKIEKVEEEKGGDEYGSNYNLKGHFSGDKDIEVDFSVSLFRMK